MSLIEDGAVSKSVIGDRPRSAHEVTGGGSVAPGALIGASAPRPVSIVISL